ncbi:uncharacterized protein BDR25DRAFT_310656 [Lindgomyces ingoldianus]|uniref:Uncharacterized protein n=1 Tax=Lindgomyces ingoldianus TaxID=673940 RepID=A0ACB6R7E9_9PLEO|nr:uncharacterized protein BDR25DRAFT_310656 [Lindgomyces ingoldianus]KAF2475233.1 hypothetical protein BDR25DRAFT_310656 [Lindgomyces ingoldianus]
MAFFPELSLGLAFTLISLAPMVPDWISRKNEPKIKPKDLWAEYTKGGNTEKAEYITVSASGTNAICITAVVVTHPSSSDTYAFLPGEVAIGSNGNVQEGRLRCLWIDRLDNNGISATHIQGFQVHLPDFKLDTPPLASGRGILARCVTLWLNLERMIPSTKWYNIATMYGLWCKEDWFDTLHKTNCFPQRPSGFGEGGEVRVIVAEATSNGKTRKYYKKFTVRECHSIHGHWFYRLDDLTGMAHEGGK